MADPKKFLDYAGLIEAFNLIKKNYAGKEYEAKITEIEKQIGTWKKSTESDFTTIAQAIAALQTLVGSTNVSTQITNAINDLDSEKTSTNGTNVQVKVTQVDGKIDAVSITTDNTASKTELGAEAAARKAVTGVDGDSYTANASTTYLKNAGSLKAADEALDSALNTLAGKVSSLESDLEDIDVTAQITEEIEKLDATVRGNLSDADAVSSGKHVGVKVVETDGKLTSVTVVESDIASDAALQAEVAARKAVDGQTGDTYSANSATQYISGATSLNDADIKLDAALKAEAAKVSALETKVGNSSVADQIAAEINKLDGTVSGTGALVTAVTQEDGKVTTTMGNLTSTDKSVTVSGLDLAVNVDGTSITKNASGQLQANFTETAYTGKDAITVTGTTSKEVALKIVEGNKVLSQSADGLTTTLSFNDNTTSKKIELQGIGGAVIAEFSYESFIVDGMLQDVSWSTESGKENELVFTWNTAAGSKKTPIDLSKYIDTYAAGKGLALDSATKTFSVKLKSEGEKYLELTEGGELATKGIDAAISAATNDMLTKTTADATYWKLEDLVAMTTADVTAAFNAATGTSQAAD